MMKEMRILRTAASRLAAKHEKAAEKCKTAKAKADHSKAAKEWRFCAKWMKNFFEDEETFGDEYETELMKKCIAILKEANK